MSPLLLAAAALAACDDGAAGAPDTVSAADTWEDVQAGDEDTASETVGATPIPEPPAGGQQLLTDPYTLASGDEKYYCYTFTAPSDADVGIVAVDNIAGQLVHHVALFRALVPEEEGFHECNVLIRLSWMPIWASGRGGADLRLPDGVAFKVQAGTQYVLQYHLLNANIVPVTERSAVNLTYVRDLQNYQPAGIFALGQFMLEIPAGAIGYAQDTGCAVEQDMTVFAAFPHMHTLGKKLELFQGPSEDTLTRSYAIDPWPFGDQPFDPVDLHIRAGEHVRSRCTWDNPTGHDVSFGESTNDEMCFLVLFAYPMPEISGCGF